MTPQKEWWRRAAAAVKDKRSLCLTTMASVRYNPCSGGPRRPEVDAAVIRATSHDERSVDYKSAGRVFALARAAPSSFLLPLMWSLAHRAVRTRSWVVALKSLLLAHGLLLCSDDAPPSARLGRIPFDLSDFHDRSSSSGFSAFVCTYFRFLDHRSLFSAQKPVKGDIFTTTPAARPGDEEEEEEEDAYSDADLAELERLQTLLDLLMQIRPYGDGMEVALILEAMDCVLIEMFGVYSSFCNGISHFLVGMLGLSSSRTTQNQASESTKRRGAIGTRVLRRAAAQSSQISAYIDLCRSLGVLNAAAIPAVRTVPEEDMVELERLLVDGVPESEAEEADKEGGGGGAEGEEDTEGAGGHAGTVITKRWVVFDVDEGGWHSGKEKQEGHFWNPFLCPPPEKPWPSLLWAPTVNPDQGALDNLMEMV